ncbi:MAG: response regulator [Patescibacteria group bacterium]
MPEKAKIFFAEDDDLVRKLVRRVCLASGHTIELEATTLEDALEKIKLAKEMGVNVAVLDGNLTKGERLKDDGEIIAQALEKEIPDIIIVSHSAILRKWGKKNLTKPEDTMKLGSTIKAL